MHISQLINGGIEEKNLDNVSFDLQFDLICVGAGSAGIYAACAAAREGVSVLLIEQDDTVGGMHIHGNVGGYYYGFPGGSFEEDDVFEKEKGLLIATCRYQQKQINELERIRRYGVCLRTSHTPTGLIMEGRRAVGLTVFDGERELFIAAKIIIDATSDGHILRMCNIKKRYGRESDGQRAPFTVRTRYIKDGKCIPVNSDSGYIDQYDSTDFSRKVIEAHRKCAAQLSLGEFLDMPTHTGIREGLTFDGEEELRYEDVLLGRRPDKVLFYAYSDFDRHGHDKALYPELMQNWWVISNLATVTVSIPVPLGSVVPKGISGLVSAGRCLSADEHTLGAVRMNRDMFRMGECVGIAAALAILENVELCDVNYSNFLTRVRTYGCFEGDASKSFGFDFPHHNKPYAPVVFTPEHTLHLLATDTPGPALWTCYLYRDDKALSDSIYSTMKSADDTLTRYNAAIALGIMSDSRALPVIREIVERRDCFYFRDCRRSNQFRSAIAVCILGRLGNEDDVPLLSEIAFDQDEIKRPLYNTLEPDYLYYAGNDRRFVYYELFTHATAALVKLYLRTGLDAGELLEKLRELYESGDAVKRIAPGRHPEDTPVKETEYFLEEMIRTLKGEKL